MSVILTCTVLYQTELCTGVLEGISAASGDLRYRSVAMAILHSDILGSYRFQKLMDRKFPVLFPPKSDFAKMLFFT